VNIYKYWSLIKIAYILDMYEIYRLPAPPELIAEYNLRIEQA